MDFNIINRRESLTVFTEVEFTFEDGSKEVIDVAHFEPQSEDEINQNIQNRYDSEVLNRNLNSEEGN
jgi:hypothetical protein